MRLADKPKRPAGWRYDVAAAEVLAEPGVMVDERDDLHALHVRDGDSGDLVTVLEVVSPSNKHSDHEILAYRERRRDLTQRGVNVVEVDITRSVKRLEANSRTQSAAYHVGIFLPGEGVRVVEMRFEASLARIALPLRADVIPIDLQSTYAQAYRQTGTAVHILQDDGYTEDGLPFPSLLTEAQRTAVFEAVAAWQSRIGNA